jgi:hypothetical protein
MKLSSVEVERNVDAMRAGVLGETWGDLSVRRLATTADMSVA